MQRKQVKAEKRKAEASGNCAPRVKPALVQMVDLGNDQGMGIICEPEDWNRMMKVRTEPRRQGS